MLVSEMTTQELEVHLKQVSKRLLTASKQAQEAIDELEERQSSTDDDTQPARDDLQNLLQRQQQTLQTISNVSKMLNDTAMAIIRNAR